MFQFPVSPQFRRVGAVIRALKSPPAFDFPPPIERFYAPVASPPLSEGVWRGVFRAVRELLLKVTALATLSACLAAAAAFVLMRMIRAPEAGAGWLVGLAAAHGALGLLEHAAVFRSARLRSQAQIAVEAYLTSRVARKLLTIDPRAAARFSSGNLKTLITSDARLVAGFVDNFIRNLLPALVILAITAPLAIQLSGRPGWVGVLAMLAQLPVTAALTAVSTRLQGRVQRRVDELTSLVGEWVRNIRLVRSLSWQEALSGDVAGGVRRLTRVSMARHWMACIIFGLSGAWVNFAAAAIAIAAVSATGKLELVPFFGTLWLLQLLNSYLMYVPNTIRTFGDAYSSAQRLREILAAPDRAENFRDQPVPEGLRDLKPVAIVFERAAFGYPAEDGRTGPWIVKPLSIRLDLSARTAIVGPVGAGKSTFLKLLIGELPPTEGRVLLELEDGSLHGLWSESAMALWRAKLAYVPQEPFVANDTLLANLSLEDEDHPAAEAEALRAAQLAELSVDIHALPQGLRQEIGEAGINLSGGQRQRLNLARAYRSHRPFLVMDDPLSAVDARTERALMDRLLEREGGFALVTHRTGEVGRASRILVLQEGRVVEDGDPKRLAREPDSHLSRVLRAYSGLVLAEDAP